MRRAACFVVWCAFGTMACNLEEKRALEAELVAAEASIAENERAFTSAMEHAASSLPGDAPCPLPVTGSIDQKYAAAALLDGSSGVVVKGSAERAKSPRAKRMAEEIARIRRELSAGDGSLASHRAHAAKLDPKTFWTWDVVVVIEAKSPAGAVDEQKGTFEARTAMGRSYAFDYAKKAIVCAGTFQATNAGSIAYQERPGHLSGYGMVAIDLEAQALREGRRALLAVR